MHKKVHTQKGTVGNFKTNYPRKMKLVPINMHYFLLQFDVLKFVLRVRLHGGLYLTLI